MPGVLGRGPGRRAVSGETCTCPDPAPSEGPGTPVVLPGKAHRRGCPVVQHIFDMQDQAARRAAGEHVRRGGLLTDPEVSRLRDEVRELRHRLDSKDGDR